MPRKKVDERLRTLIENGVKSRHRSFVVIVGDRGRDQVVNLHYMLSKMKVKARPSVLWCYKKDLGFSTHRMKRMRQVKKMMERGLYDADTDNPFDLFISSTNIRFTYYSESHKVLGNTYGMCVLQDFEALTPNLLCRTMETVEGGGLVVLLLRTMSSLRQLYEMTMDVHGRFRTEGQADVVPRFNERFILSLGSCPNCVVVDDELNILPLSKHCKAIEPLPAPATESADEVTAFKTQQEKELAELQHSLRGTQPVGALVGAARTLDQARAVMSFCEAIADKTLRNTVALTAARGRGKSAALGLAIAGAIAHGYSNVFVTAPSPENLRTLFEFVLKGLDALKFQEHTDYEVVQSTNPEFGHAVVRVNLFREHRQTVSYLHPSDAGKLAQAELVVIDEAAAIPLPIVRGLLGPYLVFLASTVTGYEGTGRSLSLKLIQQLRNKQYFAGEGQVAAAAASAPTAARTLREIALEEPIRYAPGDPVEEWLHRLLCLDVTQRAPRLAGGCPHPSDCELYYVNRDALFSYHKLSEAFLQRVMSLYVASHYKNSPNDLQLLADAPAHHLFVLMPRPNPDRPRPDADDGLPDVLAVVQVAMEGKINQAAVRASLAKGYRAPGDLIPWTVAQQFQDGEFASLSGARVVRIATHPDVLRMGYGSRAVTLLGDYFAGKIANLDEAAAATAAAAAAPAADGKAGKGLLKEKLRPRKHLPPLLAALADRPPERLHWVGTSFGLTQDLYGFWSKAGYRPVYLRQTPNDLTGEHTVIMIKPLACDDLEDAPAAGWLDPFVDDFRRRFVSLLAYEFRTFRSVTALTVMDLQRKVGGGLVAGGAGGGAASAEAEADGDNEDAAGSGAGGSAGEAVAVAGALTGEELGVHFTPHDLKRLESYARNLVDYHMIVDLLPTLARLFFLRRLPDVSMSHLQSVILLALGLQHKGVDALEVEVGVPVRQLLAMFNKATRKLSNKLRQLQEAQVEKQLQPQLDAGRRVEAQAQRGMQPLAEGLQADLEAGAQEALRRVTDQHKSQAAKDSILRHVGDLSEFAVAGDDEAWQQALQGGRSKGVPAIVSVKSKAAAEKRRRAAPDIPTADEDEQRVAAHKAKKRRTGRQGKAE